MAEQPRSKKRAAGGSTSGPRPASRADSKGRGRAQDPVCPVAFCPVGMALSTAQLAGPDVVEHLLAAAREFLLAARAAIDVRADGFERKDGNRLERIEIG